MSQVSNSAKGICRIFASGRTCRFGNSCRYIHSNTIQDESLSGIYQDSSGAEQQRRLCPQYQKTRFCKFGAKCRYLHRLAEPLHNIPVENHPDNHGSLNEQKDLNTGPHRDVSPNGGDKPYFRLPLPSARNNGSDRRRIVSNSQHDPRQHFLDHGNNHSSTTPDVRHDDYYVDRTTENEAPARDVRRRYGYGPARSGRRPYQSAGQTRQHSKSSSAELSQLCDDLGSVESKEEIPEDGAVEGTNPVERVDENQEVGNEAQSRNNKAGRKHGHRRLCRYYKAGRCSMEDRCRFWHPSTIAEKENMSTSDKPGPEKREKIVFRKPSELPLETMTEEDAKKHHKTEVDQLLKRFPKAENVIADEGRWSCHVRFVPSDPDWIYDVKSVTLKITFPASYPKEPMAVTAVEDQQMPQTLTRYVDRSVLDWISSRFSELTSQNKTELMFRPFLKWLDRNLEELFTEGLKQYKRELMAAAAGVQFISAAELRERQKSSSEEEVDASEDDLDDTEDEDDDTDEESDDELPPPQPGHVGEMPPEDTTRSYGQCLEPVRKGTEVKLQKLELAENAATLKAQKVKVIVQCCRCKNKAEFSTLTGKNNQVTCGKCSQDMLVMFRPNLVHQMSSILGYMDLYNCVAFDVVLVDCVFEVGCFNCNKEMKMEGLSVGQPKEAFCHFCHKKMKISTDSVRFLQLEPSDMLGSANVHILDVPKKKKIPKDPAIQEGKPLPNEGACKHYKKSFRWFRFPCCGKVYPCDVCHDEKEGDHEMAFANRMICGFCCKEQPFSAEKPCIACGFSLTKKATAHWEGGKGCRDRIKMSRDDNKKYANMGKTVSKKSEAKKTNKGKKTTKLRHA